MSDKAKRGFPFSKGKDDATFYKAVPLDEEGNPDEVSQSDKVKGAAQLAAGTMLTAAGIPMLILPGPGAVAIAGGAALALKGHRTMTGREATPLEEKVDYAAEQLAAKAKADAASMGDRIADEASKARERIAKEAPEKAAAAARKAPEAVASAAKKVPDAVAGAAKVMPEAAAEVAEVVPSMAASVAEKAPEIASGAAKGAKVLAGTAAELARKGVEGFKSTRKK